MSVCLSTQILVQKMTIFIGNESFLLRVVVVFVGAGRGRGVEESTKVTSRLKYKISIVCSYFQAIETGELYVDLSNFLILCQLKEAISQTNQF